MNEQERRLVITLTSDEYKVLQFITQHEGGTIDAALRWLIHQEGKRRGWIDETNAVAVRTGGLSLTRDEVIHIVTDFAIQFVQERLTQLASILPDGTEGSTLEFIGKLHEHLQTFSDNRDIGPAQAGFPQQWVQIGLYGQYLYDEEADTMRALTQTMASTLFKAPGLDTYTIPEAWADTPIGRLWWCAVVRMEGNELMTLAEASQLSGISLPALSNRLTAGTLKAYINPMAPNPRKGRTLVKRSDVLRK